MIIYDISRELFSAPLYPDDPEPKLQKIKSFEYGDIYNLSSYQMLGGGPTGAALPTVTAPGVLVVAAGSRYSYLGRPNSPYRVMEVA